MSSAANHRKRSCRSYARHASAMRGVRRYTIQMPRFSYGAGPSFLSRFLQMFHRDVQKGAKGS